MNQALSHLHGRALSSLDRDATTDQWVFGFGAGVAPQVSCAWRLVADGRVALGWRDDGQRFGLPAPLEAARVLALLGFSNVDTTEISSLGDLVVRFTAGAALEVFNDSSGYEGWQLNGPGERCVVAQGGGKVVDPAT